MSEHEIKRQQRIVQRLAWLEKGEPFDVKGFIEDVRALLYATRSTIAAPAQHSDDATIDAAEALASLYDGDDRQDIKTDVMNAFYAGVKFACAAHVQDQGKRHRHEIIADLVAANKRIIELEESAVAPAQEPTDCPNCRGSGEVTVLSDNGRSKTGGRMNIDLDELKRLALAATSGPWQSYSSNVYFGLGRGGFDLRDGPRPEENAAFISAANPAVILELIRMVREGM